jgi:hypothetical protein
MPHLGPVRPGKQLQTYDPGVLIQFPPFKHGFCKHSSTSKNIFTDCLL